jgi:hypothetical protein
LARRGSKSDRMFMSLNKATPVLWWQKQGAMGLTIFGAN